MQLKDLNEETNATENGMNELECIRSEQLILVRGEKSVQSINSLYKIELYINLWRGTA